MTAVAEVSPVAISIRLQIGHCGRWFLTALVAGIDLMPDSDQEGMQNVSDGTRMSAGMI